jgi:hypothetical protein
MLSFWYTLELQEFYLILIRTRDLYNQAQSK